jgi:5-(carboxyamino)imidazole ribonucleotide mutase
MAKVAVICGSSSDQSYADICCEVLAQMGLQFEKAVISAHRHPEKIRAFSASLRTNGFSAVIAMAGMAAHLPGVIASMTTLPVIGVPIPSSALGGQDALYSIVQMPAGIPVATVAIGNAGAKNAAYLAAQIIGINDPDVRQNYENYRASL